VSEELITSVANPLVKRMRKLRGRKTREAEGAFLVEGIAQTRQALDHGAPLELLFVAPDLLSSPGAWTAIEGAEASGTRVVRLGRDAFESIVERDHPSGLGAIAKIVDRPVTDLHATEGGFFVALDSVGNPGNLGSIVRTVDAAGGAGVVILGHATDPWHPQSMKASMGTLFTIPVCRADDFEDLLAWCLMEKVDLVTTSARAESSFWDTDYKEPTIFMFGSESAGLSAHVHEKAQHTVGMPMEGAASSLNLSVSVGVMLYEAKRQQRASTQSGASTQQRPRGS
jgi:TrmH family RNA methyltransferase